MGLVLHVCCVESMACQASSRYLKFDIVVQLWNVKSVQRSKAIWGVLQCACSGTLMFSHLGSQTFFTCAHKRQGTLKMAGGGIILFKLFIHSFSRCNKLVGSISRSGLFCSVQSQATDSGQKPACHCSPASLRWHLPCSTNTVNNNSFPLRAKNRVLVLMIPLSWLLYTVCAQWSYSCSLLGDISREPAPFPFGRGRGDSLAPVKSLGCCQDTLQGSGTGWNNDPVLSAVSLKVIFWKRLA